MPNNYTPSYNQYLTHTAGYALPSSVRSYSVFDPSSNSWRRMTNDGRSPMPTQGQTPIVPAQPVVQTQTPSILLRPKQQAQPQPAQITRPLARSNARTNVKPKISGYNSDDAILRVADIPPEVTLGTQPAAVRTVSVNMSPDHRVPTPYVSNETTGLAGYNPNIAMSPVALTTTGRQAPVVDFPEYVNSPITRDLLRLGRGFRRLFSRPSMAKEATAALRASTGLPPLE